jgi:hypothetical protein
VIGGHNLGHSAAQSDVVLAGQPSPGRLSTAVPVTGLRPHTRTRTMSEISEPHATREHSLVARAEALGLAWAMQWREALAADGRPAAGAWPGTLSEARARIDHMVAIELRGTRSATVDDSARAELSRALYAAAKRHWNEHREREED